MRSPHATAALVALLVVALLTACSRDAPAPQGGAPTTLPPLDAPSTGAAEPFAAQELAWAPCPEQGDAAEDLQCASLRVPVDWAAPEGATIELALARVPAPAGSNRTSTSVPRWSQKTRRSPGSHTVTRARSTT